MGTIIHNAIAAFFKIFVPIVYITFILAGLSCAFVSAVIEYDVFSELFKISTTEASFISVPWLIVFAFESTKIFLIFLHKQYSITGNSSYVSDKTGFLRLRFTLIFISFIATLLFSFYNLQSPEYEQQLAKATAISQQHYKFQLQQLHSSFDVQEQQLLEPVDQAIAEYDRLMREEEKYRFSDGKEFRGPRYKAYKAEKKSKEEQRIGIINSVNIQRREAVEAMDENRAKKNQTIQHNLTTFLQSGNKMLLATLRILNMKSEFPEWQYVFIVAILSLLLSLGMEFIIWSSFTVLAIHHGDIFDFGIQTQKFKTASEAATDLDETEIKNTAEKIRRTAKVVVDSAQKQARNTVEKMKDI